MGGWMDACRPTPRSALRLPRRCGWTKLSPVLELVSPSGMEQQQGLGPGQSSRWPNPAASGVPPPGLSQKKMQLQQHMSMTKVGVCFVEAGYRPVEVGSVMGASWHIALLNMLRSPRHWRGGVPVRVNVGMGSGTIPVRRGRFDPSGSHSQELQVETQAAALRNRGARGSLAVEGSGRDKLSRETASGPQCPWVGSRGSLVSGDLRRMGGRGWVMMGGQSLSSRLFLTHVDCASSEHLRTVLNM